MSSLGELRKFLRLKIAFGTASFGVIAFLLFNNMGSAIVFPVASIFLLTIAGYSYNSVTDVKEDRTNLGRVNKFAEGAEGKAIAFAFFAGGTAFALFLETVALAAYLAAAFLFWAYSKFRVKKVLLGKNVYIWLLFALVFLIGTNATEPTAVGIAYSIFFSAFIFVQSIIADLRDVKGDRKAGLKTLPIALGTANAKALLTVFIVAWQVSLLAISPLFFVLFVPFTAADIFFLAKGEYTKAHLSGFVGAHVFSASLVLVNLFIYFGGVV